VRNDFEREQRQRNGNYLHGSGRGSCTGGGDVDGNLDYGWDEVGDGGDYGNRATGDYDCGFSGISGSTSAGRDADVYRDAGKRCTE
jgi:hypothetical protein